MVLDGTRRRGAGSIANSKFKQDRAKARAKAIRVLQLEHRLSIPTEWMFASKEVQLLTLSDGVGQSVGLLTGMYPEAREEIRHAANVCASGGEAEQEIPVHGEVKRRVDAPDFFVDRPSPKKCLLRHIVKMADDAGSVAGQNPAAYFPPRFVNDDAVSIDNIDTRMCGKILSDE